MEAPICFDVKRLGQTKGPDTHEHVFCVRAIGNKELIRTGESKEFALINGASGSDPAVTRLANELFADALNEVVAAYYRGEFHEAVANADRA